MWTRPSMLALAAAAAVTMHILVPGSASAFGLANRTGASAHAVTSVPAPSYRRGYGFGPGWCYWHPYACYYR